MFPVNNGYKKKKKKKQKKLRSYSLNLKLNGKRPSIDSVFFPLRHLLIRQSSYTPLKLARKCYCHRTCVTIYGHFLTSMSRDYNWHGSGQTMICDSTAICEIDDVPPPTVGQRSQQYQGSVQTTEGITNGRMGK